MGPAAMHTFLREQLPVVFKYLAQKNPWVMLVDADDDDTFVSKELPYVMLGRNGRQFSVSEVQHPTAAHYEQLKSRGSAGWKQSSITIGKLSFARSTAV